MSAPPSIEAVQALVASRPQAAPAELAAAGVHELGAACFSLRDDPEHGDVAFDAHVGGIGVDRWGQGVTRPRKAAREIEARPGCLIGFQLGDQRVVIDPSTREVRPERQRAIASQPGGPSKSRTNSLVRTVAEQAPLPQPPSPAEAMAALSDVLAEQVRLEDAAVTARATVGALERRKAEAVRSNERALKAVAKAATEAVARGEPIPDAPRLRDAIVKGETEVAACDAARPAALEAAKAAEKALAEYDRSVAAVALDLDAALTAEALPAAQSAIGSLAEPLAQLAAVSIVRERLLGERFPVDPRRHKPIGARQVVALFIESIPAPLRPDSLTIEAIEERAEAIAEALLNQVQHSSEQAQ